MESTVMELILRPFSNRTFEDQLRIVRGGRPFTRVNAFPQNGATDIETAARCEQLTNCKVQWLTFCPIRGGFFCWPCLLFDESENPWNRHGFYEWGSLSEKVLEHEMTFEHIQAELKLKMFYTQQVKPLDLKLEINMKLQAEVSELCRTALKCLVDMIFYRVAKEHASQDGNYNARLLDSKDFINALCLIQDHGDRDTEVTDKAKELITKSPTIISDLVDSITSFVKLEIKKEASVAANVSVILTEHSGVPDKSRISTVLRYVKGVETCERFLGFNNASSGRLACDVFEHVSSIINEFDISEQFLAYSLDGGVLPLEELPDFVKELKGKYPHSVFVPWWCHSVLNVLLQGLTCIKECKIFFKNINGIKYFFRENSKTQAGFHNFLFGRRSGKSWIHNRHIVLAVCEYRKIMVKYFDRFVEYSKMFDADSVATACGYRIFLEEFRTVFLIKLFDQIFKNMLHLSAVLRSSVAESIFVHSTIGVVKNKLFLLQKDGFQDLWSSVVQELSCSCSPEFGDYHKLFDTILDHVNGQLRVRFDDLSKLASPLIPIDIQSVVSWSHHIAGLLAAQGHVVDKADISNELDVLQGSGYHAHTASIATLYEFFVNSGIKSSLPNLFKLAEVCYALPIRRPRTDSDSKHETIQKWAFCPDTAMTRGDTAVLLVEVDFLKSLRERKTFSDEVISVFGNVHDISELV